MNICAPLTFSKIHGAFNLVAIWMALVQRTFEGKGGFFLRVHGMEWRENSWQGGEAITKSTAKLWSGCQIAKSAWMN